MLAIRRIPGATGTGAVKVVKMGHAADGIVTEGEVTWRFRDQDDAADLGRRCPSIHVCDARRSLADSEWWSVMTAEEALP